mgnify:CR=1 FL=1
MSTFEADWYRRAFVKRNEQVMFDFLEQIGDHPRREEIHYLLSRMDGFGLCKAHAINLGRLIYAQAYERLHNPQRYWLAVLQNACSMYRPWVHMEHAKRAGWTIQGNKRPWLVKDDILYNHNWQVPLFDSHWDQLAARGFWTHASWIPGTWFQQMGNLVSFCGLIATHRQYHKGGGEYVTFATVGTDPGSYVDVCLPGAVNLKGAAFVEGMGVVDVRNNCMSVTVNRFDVISLRDHKQKYG